MKRILVTIGFFLLINLALHLPCNGQEETKPKKELKNTVWINIFNPIIDAKYLVLGYERVLKNNQTFTFNIGRFSLPKFSIIDTDKLGLTGEYKDWGINTSVDYRFYLGKLNKYNAPRGVYLAPYYSFNHFNRENNWTLKIRCPFDIDIVTDFTLNINTLGGQLGYQFIFWRRLVVDLVLIGPGVGFYGLNVNLDTSLAPDDESLFFQTLNDALKDKFPGYDLVIESGEFEKKGSVRATTLGFRYMIHIGFRF